MYTIKEHVSYYTWNCWMYKISDCARNFENWSLDWLIFTVIHQPVPQPVPGEKNRWQETHWTVLENRSTHDIIIMSLANEKSRRESRILYIFNTFSKVSISTLAKERKYWLLPTLIHSSTSRPRSQEDTDLNTADSVLSFQTGKECIWITVKT